MKKVREFARRHDRVIALLSRLRFAPGSGRGPHGEWLSASLCRLFFPYVLAGREPRIFSASGSCTSFWIERFNGRAPKLGSKPSVNNVGPPVQLLKNAKAPAVLAEASHGTKRCLSLVMITLSPVLSSRNPQYSSDLGGRGSRTLVAG